MPEKVLVGYQRYLDGGWKPLHRFVWAPGEMARLREETEVHRCEHCDKVIAGRRIRYQDIYQPFSMIPDTYYYCEPCSDRGYDLNGDHRWCEGCDREIWDSNGHRLNFVLYEGSDAYCAHCVQQMRFEHGHSDAEIEAGPIPCDWYDYTELAAHGFEEGERFSGSMLEQSGGKEWREYCRTLKLAGYIVLTDQGTTGLGKGYPDWVTVYYKDPAAIEAA